MFSHIVSLMKTSLYLLLIIIEINKNTWNVRKTNFLFTLMCHKRDLLYPSRVPSTPASEGQLTNWYTIGIDVATPRDCVLPLSPLGLCYPGTNTEHVCEYGLFIYNFFLYTQLEFCVYTFGTWTGIIYVAKWQLFNRGSRLLK